MTDRLDRLPPPTGASLIVAANPQGAIGRQGQLPWHLPEDLAHFRQVTMGHTVVIGSATWHSIGRPLPGRRLVVVSGRDLSLPDGVVRHPDPDEALTWAESVDPTPIVAGGAQIYRALLARVGRAYLTDVNVSVADADAFFPALPTDEWTEVASWEGDDARLAFRVLDRASC